MNVVKTGKVGAFVGQTRFPEVVPHLPIGRAVQLVDGLGGGGVFVTDGDGDRLVIFGRVGVAEGVAEVGGVA